MTPSIRWVPDDVPSVDKTPFVEAVRFTGTGKTWRVWLLGDARCVAVHYTPGQKTMPCLAESGDCPFCANPLWWKRTEAYAPAMLEIKKLPKPEWQPILAIFTAGGAKQLGVKPHRGKMFEVQREARNARCTPLKLSLVQVSDPLRPAFDIEPLIKRLWWPDQADIGAIELPEPIPIPLEEVNRAPFVPTLQPLALSEEEKARLTAQFQAAGGMKNLAAKILGTEPATPPAPTPTPTVSPAPQPDVTPTVKRGAQPSVLASDPEAQLELERKRARERSIRNKPIEEVTPGEAVEAGRICEYIVGAAVDASTNGNGHHPQNGKKGGAA